MKSRDPCAVMSTAYNKSITISLLNAALNLAGTKAASAYIHLARRTVYNYVYALDVGSPDPLGFTVGMTYQIAGHSALVAYFAKLAHVLTPPYPTYSIIARKGLRTQTNRFYHTSTTFARKNFYCALRLTSHRRN